MIKSANIDLGASEIVGELVQTVRVECLLLFLTFCDRLTFIFLLFTSLTIPNMLFRVELRRKRFHWFDHAIKKIVI